MKKPAAIQKMHAFELGRVSDQVVGGHVYQNNHIEKQQQAMSGTHNGAWGSGHNPLSSGVMHQSNTSHNQHQNPNNGFNHQVGLLVYFAGAPLLLCMLMMRVK